MPHEHSLKKHRDCKTDNFNKKMTTGAKRKTSFKSTGINIFV